MLRKIAIIALSACLIWTIAACGEGSNFGSVTGNKDKKSDDHDESEDEPADKPANVAGAFLTCYYLAPETESKTLPTGCRLAKDDEKIDAEDHKMSLTLLDKDEKQVAMQTARAPEESHFHMIAGLPSANKENSTLEMLVADDKNRRKTFRLATKEIKEFDELKKFKDENTPEAPSEGIFLDRIPVHSSWNASVNIIDAALDGSSFCDEGGIHQKMPITSTGGSITTFMDILTGAATEGKGTNTSEVQKITEHTPPQIVSPASQCFKPVKFSGETDYAIATSGGNCLFMLTDQNILVIITPQRLTDEFKTKDNEVNIKNLKYTAARSCGQNPDAK